MGTITLNTTLAIILLITICSAVIIGTGDLTIIGNVFSTQSLTPTEQLILYEIRLPRTLIAAIVGASLALAGAAIQGLLRNPLADPSVIGTSQGAAVGAACVFYFSLFSSLGAYAISLAAFLGAFASLLLIFAIARGRGAIYILLAGLCINTLASAVLALQLHFAPNPFAIQELVFWLMGSVANLTLTDLSILVPFSIVGAAMVLRTRPYLFALTLGERSAASMGFNDQRSQAMIIVGCALLIGASVALAGAIAFVGLVVPHLVRPLVAQRPDSLLIPSALTGACLLVLADTLVQSITITTELKLGVITSLLGAPIFIAIVAKQNKLWPN